MGILTVSLDNEVEERLRRLAAQRLGKRKGYLSEALEQAINLWAKKEETGAESKMMALLKKGFKMGKVTYSREELHER